MTGCIPPRLREIPDNDLDELGLPFCDCSNGGAVSDAVNNPGLASDCEVLLASRNTLADTVTLNWSIDTPIERWEGVRVGGTPQRVVELWLGNKQMSGEIPASLGDLENLQTLIMGHNELTGDLPAELGRPLLPDMAGTLVKPVDRGDT